jgi:membrane protease subunit HflK
MKIIDIFKNSGPWGDEPEEDQTQEKQKKSFSKKPELNFGSFFNKNSGDIGHVGLILGVLLIGGWLASGFYQINPDEQGIVLRFGKWIKTTEPGWHYHIPYPVDKVLKPKITVTNQINIGFGSKEESLILTGDRNIVDLSFVVQWRIKDPIAYLFHIRDTETTIKQAAESVMRDTVGQMPIDTTFSEGRVEIETIVKKKLQELLDEYGAGVYITEVNLKNVDPPEQVVEAFYEALRADSDRERYINQAEAYANDVLPKAHGEAAKIIAQGKGQKEAVIAQAEGSASRFLAILKEYQKQPEVTKKRLYNETMERILENANKVVMSSKNQGVLPHMPLPALKKGGNNE